MPAEATSSVLTAERGASTKSHFPLDVQFPVYSVAWTDDKTVVLAGGGGSSRTGVKNRLSKVLAAGINSSAAELEKGVNENLRIFAVADSHLKAEKRRQTLSSTDPDHYQKVTAFSRSSASKLLAVGSTNSELSLLSYPDLRDVCPPLEYNGEEIFDADFSDDGTMVADSSTVPEPLQVIERPVLKRELACTFRAAKFGRRGTATNLYTVVNAAPSGSVRKPPAGSKKAFVSLWDAKAWRLLKTRTVSQKPVTAFDVSDDGSLLAYGSSDLSIGILDAVTLRPIVTVLHAHDFPVTSLKFNPAGTLLVSGSADNSIRVIQVPPPDQRGGGNSASYLVLLTLLVLVLAILIQQTFGEDLLQAARAALTSPPPPPPSSSASVIIMSSDRDQLLAMGFQEAQVNKAQRATKNAGLTQALDYLEKHADESEDWWAEVEEGGEEAVAGEEAKSLKCSECGKLFRNQALASYHSTKSGHTEFEESTEELKPLTEEEKAQKLEELRAKMAEKKKAQAKLDAEENRRNEEIRRKSGKDEAAAKEALKVKEALRAADQRKKEKEDDLKARKRIREQIEADKQARAAKSAREKALREGRNPDLAAEGASTSSPAAAGAGAAPAAPSEKKVYDSARLQIRVPSGPPLVHTLPATATLGEVAQWIEEQSGLSGFTLTCSFPRKTYGDVDLGTDLKTLGLTPSAVLLVQ
ncbi:hypothetical protein JCM8202v2_005632 [Rhodotorula sphaerocarpa]